MKYLFSDWEYVSKKIKKNKQVLLLSDYDGTLTPIASSPKKALFSSKTRELLKILAKNKYFKVGVISGRQLKELKKIIKLPGLYYVGTHGLEILVENKLFVYPPAKSFSFIRKKIIMRVKKIARNIKGVVIEDKGLSISFHYRKVDAKKIVIAKKEFRKICKPYIDSKKAIMISGKKMLELKPNVNWDKGKAVKYIRKTLQIASSTPTIYIGDDKTDEDVFKIMRKTDLAVHVGRSRSSKAEYYLKDTKDVKVFLEELLNY